MMAAVESEATATGYVLALPKGRILREIAPLLAAVGIEPDAALYDEASRALRFHTNVPTLDVVRVRAFDVATYVAFGAAQIGIAGSDVIDEFGYQEIYAPVDLGIARCRLVVAEPTQLFHNDDPGRWSHIRVATKYPQQTRRHFAGRGVQAECVVLSGAMELAPQLDLCDRIVDLVDTGRTLAANGLQEIEQIADVSAQLIVNRTALKLNPGFINPLIARFRAAANDPRSASV
ncbi:MAG: ATP phosphoribosyltransferase [Rhodospirillaceae bacterium]|nr:ATP phosphoribosyltransferase [Rhodospirillaceae bacterium]